MNHNRTFYGKKVCVIIPCMNRIEMFIHNFPRWLEQIYSNYQIVIVDYNSERSIYSDIKKICDRYKAELDYNNPESEAKVSLLRSEGLETFNMSHALNIGIRNSKSDIVSIAGTETIPCPYYLEVVMMSVDANVFTRCHFGRLSFPRHMIDAINGYPEIFEYWGGEDDVVTRAFLENGMFLLEIDSLLAHDVNNLLSNKLSSYSKFDRNANRRGIEAKTGSNINLRRYHSYKTKRGIVNNYGKKYGDKLPVLIDPSDDTGTHTESLKKFPEFTYWGKRCAVVIPCMDRLNNLQTTLPMWIEQIYKNKQIVIVDYGSSIPVYKTVEMICEQYKQKLCYNVFDPKADCIVFRVNGITHFNMSHAYNYAIRRIETDIITTVCADSCPRDYYLDCCINLVDDYHFVQSNWGLHTIRYADWKRINGHQEITIGYGVEDEDFASRAKLAGLNQIILPKHLVFHIPNTYEEKGLNREVPDIKNSELINRARLYEYIGKFGFVGNYGLPVGCELPISFIPYDEMKEKNLIKLTVCVSSDLDKTNLPSGIKYSEEYDVFYLLTQDWFDWKDICTVQHAQIFIVNKNETTIDKYLYYVSQRANIKHISYDA